MTPLARSILKGLAAETDRLLALDRNDFATWPADWKIALSDLPKLGVKLDLQSWSGQPLYPTHRQRCRRTLLQLEAAGLVKLNAKWGGRVTHAKLTKAGEAAARSLETHRD